MPTNEDRPTESSALPPVAGKVDRVLCEIDDRLDWLRALSPLDTRGLWRVFHANGYRRLPVFQYPAVDPDMHRLRRRLLALPVEDVEHKELQALLWEKQRELDRRIELVELRDTSGFLPASIDLWGTAEPDLVACAEDLLGDVDPPEASGETAGCEQVCAEAARQLEAYRGLDPSFPATVSVVEDLNAKLMVSRGNLVVAEDILVEAAQVSALIHHEIGTHALTRYNGACQPVEQLQCGLARWHGLQEGLGVLSEYLSGHLSAARVRVLAARVIATHRICQGNDVTNIFAELVEDYALEPHEAFTVALRVARGGGMTKDAAYLRGLRDLLAHLHAGGSLEFLFVGRLALSQVAILRQLERDGLLRPPALLPLFLRTPEGRERLERCRMASLLDLVTESRP